MAQHPSNKVEPSNVEELFTSKRLDEEQVADVLNIRACAIDLAHAILARSPDCADRSASLRALRESVMWANAAIAKRV